MQLLYFSPVAAGSYAQRPHFMARVWLEWGVESVLWVNPYPCRLPRLSDLRPGPAATDRSPHCDPRIRVLNLPALPIEPLPLGAWLNRRLLWRSAWRRIERYAGRRPTIVGVGRPCALALAALDELRPAGSFYDAMDNFPEFYGGLSRRALDRRERAVAERVDLITASSTFLADKFARRGHRVEKVLNAWGNDECGVLNDEFHIHHSSFIIHNSPVLGYIGCMGRWFDWPLAIRLARAMPEVRLELIGPCAVRPPAKLPENVRLLPACTHREAAGRLAGFSAGLIPFANNALTAGVDPIKYYDYRAAGLPVLSTSFGEMALRGRADGVFFLDQSDDPAKVVREAIGRRFAAEETVRFRRENNWRRRFQGSGLLSLLCASRRRCAA